MLKILHCNKSGLRTFFVRLQTFVKIHSVSVKVGTLGGSCSNPGTNRFDTAEQRQLGQTRLLQMRNVPFFHYVLVKLQTLAFGT